MRANGLIENKHYVSAGGMVFAMFVSRSGTLGTQTATAIRYMHQDRLGSVAVVTDELGNSVEQFAYDPWGKRRFVNGVADPLDAIVALSTDRGFTLHEHLDEVGVIHMNGRIYDPLIGRFMSADPFIQSPENLQSHNRYAYVLNNPLTLTDPSGYFSLKKLFRAALAIGVGYFTGQWIGNMFAQSAGWTGSAFYSVSTGSALGPVLPGLTPLGSVLAGAGGGFASGAIGSGTLSGAFQGAFSGGLFGGAAHVGAEGSLARIAAHGVAGCIGGAAGGGSCGAGAASAMFGKFATNASGGIESPVARGVIATLSGGVGSVIAGGKFENGAVTAAFGYLFNCLAHKCNGADYGSEKGGFHEYGPMEQQLCNESQGGCMAAARQQLMCNSAPGQASCGSPGRLVENNLSGGNPVTQYAVNPDMIINGTSPGHVFHDGYVVRWLSVNEAGNVSVWTYGRGNNSNLATQIGNQVGGSLIFLKKGAENRAGVRRALNE